MPPRADNQRLPGKFLQKRRSHDVCPAYLDCRLHEEEECLSLSLPSLSSTNKDLVNVSAVQSTIALTVTGCEVCKHKKTSIQTKPKTQESWIEDQHL